MSTRNPRSVLELAWSQLRALTFSAPDGTLLGGELELIARLGVSRATLRQAARMLEAEGLLSVRRGPSGGYFSARPNTETLHTALGGYLDTLNLNVEETYIVGFALWSEMVRQAALKGGPEVTDMAERFRQRLDVISDDSPTPAVLEFEDDYRRTVFEVVDRPYVQLMFMLNRAVTWRYLAMPPGDPDDPREHAFVREWRTCKRMELDAIEEGDEVAAVMAASRDRSLWSERLLTHGVIKSSLAAETGA